MIRHFPFRVEPRRSNRGLLLRSLLALAGLLLGLTEAARAQRGAGGAPLLGIPPPSAAEQQRGLSPERTQAVESFLLEFARKHSLPYPEVYRPEGGARGWGEFLFSDLPDHLQQRVQAYAARVLLGARLPEDYSYQASAQWPETEGRPRAQVNGRPARWVLDSSAQRIGAQVGPAERRVRIPAPDAIHATLIWAKGRWEAAVTVQRFRPPGRRGIPEQDRAVRADLLAKAMPEALRLAELLDTALESGPEPTELRIELLDANPLFTHNKRGDTGARSNLGKEPTPVGGVLAATRLPLAAPPTARDDLALSTMVTERLGAATDGVSLLLVRMRLPKKGQVTFSLAGSGELGSLHPLQGKLFAPGPVRTDLPVATRRILHPGGVASEYAFALYRPPWLTWGGGASHREVTLRAAFKPAGGRGEERKERAIRLIRPPVVLVHGTYDNPKNCWLTPFKTPQGGTLSHLTDRLRAEGFLVFLLDWERTNGSSNPSDFVTNERTVYLGLDPPWTEEQLQRARWEDVQKGGIRHALQMFRRYGFAATQADLVGHSQGGVIARVFAKGVRSNRPRPPGDPHYTAPERCSNCWYHDPYSFHRGSIRRLITLCATHRGSEICRLLNAYMHVARPSEVLSGRMLPQAAVWTSLLLLAADWQQGVFTGGFRDQTPSSTALRAIGPTPVPSHAIACIAEDSDMADVLEDGTYYPPGTPGSRREKGYYQQRLELIWSMTTWTAAKAAFEYLGQGQDAQKLLNLRARQDDLESEARSFSVTKAQQAAPTLELWKRENPWKLRAAVFRDENDCTVSKTSALGGLQPPFATVVPHVLHGYAPRYPAVQTLIVGLLTDGGGRFAPNGFPAAYPPDGPTEVRQPVPPSPGRTTAPRTTVPRATAKPPVAPARTARAGGTAPAALPIPARTAGSRTAAPADTDRFGAQFERREDGPTVTAIRPGSPAAAAGLKPGDVLMAIAGTRADRLKPEEITERLQSPSLFHRGVTVARGHEILELKPPPPATPPEGPGRPAPPETPRPGEAKPLEADGFTPAAWDLQAAGAATTTLDGGRLLFRVPAGAAGSVEAWSRRPLAGDFVLSFGQRMEDWAHSPGDTFSTELRIAPTAKAEAGGLVIRRRILADGSDAIQIVAGGQSQLVTVRGRHLNVALRRRGAEWSLLQFDPDDGEWFRLARVTQQLPNEVYLGLLARKAGASPLLTTLMLGPNHDPKLEQDP